MAQHQYDVVTGNSKIDIKANQTVGAAIGTSAVRVTIDDVNCTTKELAHKALLLLVQTLVEGPWPPVP